MSAVSLPETEAAEPRPSPELDTTAELPRRDSELPSEDGAPTWMVTFGDMIALLLTSFILLFSMSEIEVKKFREAAKSLHEGFGTSTADLGDIQPIVITPTSDSTVPRGPDPVDEQLDEIADALEEFVKDNGLEQSVLVERAEEGIYLRIRDAALFKPGFAAAEDQSAWIIEQLSLITTAIDVPVTVAGHTDNMPIASSRYMSNWELSAARAAGVARALVGLGHDATEVPVTAFGEHRPVDTNETAEGRSRNRRVELFYSRQSVAESQIAQQGDSGSASDRPSDSG